MSQPPVEPRRAASLIVWRQTSGTAQTEVLMGRRSAGHRFMPSMLVFPGGAVDEADFTSPCAAPLAPITSARLERSVSPALAQALATAAARELREEVGLSLGCPPMLNGLAYICRAITPAASPIRFDAFFFAVEAANVSGALVGSAEIEQPGFISLELAAQAKLAGATRGVLAQFAQWLLHRSGAAGVPVLRERVWAME